MYKLTPKHLVFLIMGTTIVSLKTYPGLIIANAGRDIWIVFIIASILIFIFVNYLLSICKNTHSYDIYDIYIAAMGKRLGTILLMCFVATLFLTLLESASLDSSAMHENMLLETPPWYVLIFFLGSSVYTVTRGLKPMIITTIIGIFFISIAGINLGIMTMKYKEAKYLLPIMANGVTPGFLLGILKTLGLYGHCLILLPFLPKIHKQGSVIKGASIGLLLVIQMQIISAMGIITTFGPKRAIDIWYPKLIQTQLVSYFGFLESGEFFVILQIVAGWFIKYVITFYAMLLILHKFKLKTRYTPYVITALVAFLSYFSSKNIMDLFNLLNYYIYISFAMFIVVPFFVFTIFYMKYKKNPDIICSNNSTNDNQNISQNHGSVHSTSNNNKDTNNDGSKDSIDKNQSENQNEDSNVNISENQGNHKENDSKHNNKNGNNSKDNSDHSKNNPESERQSKDSSINMSENESIHKANDSKDNNENGNNSKDSSDPSKNTPESKGQSKNPNVSMSEDENKGKENHSKDNSENGNNSKNSSDPSKNTPKSERQSKDSSVNMSEDDDKHKETNSKNFNENNQSDSQNNSNSKGSTEHSKNKHNSEFKSQGSKTNICESEGKEKHNYSKDTQKEKLKDHKKLDYTKSKSKGKSIYRILIDKLHNNDDQ